MHYISSVYSLPSFESRSILFVIVSLMYYVSHSDGWLKLAYLVNKIFTFRLRNVSPPSTSLQVLDRLVLYLRIVHSIDYYNTCEYPSEDEMPNRCGMIHVRGPIPPNRITHGEGQCFPCLCYLTWITGGKINIICRNVCSCLAVFYHTFSPTGSFAAVS